MRLILIVLWFIAYASFAWGVLRFFTRTVRVGWHTGLVAPLGLASGLWHLTAVITTRATAWDQAAGACCVAGATLLFWSAVSACGALRPTAIFETDSPAHLLCSGPYRYIRHPFYASYTLFWIGGTVAAQSLVSLAFAAAMFSLYLSAIRSEERKFADSSLADAYADYARVTGRLLPTQLLRRAGGSDQQKASRAS